MDKVGGRACRYMHMFNPACEGWCFTACCGGLGAQSIAYVDFFVRHILLIARLVVSLSSI